jgi:hypothetical protein
MLPRLPVDRMTLEGGGLTLESSRGPLIRLSGLHGSIEGTAQRLELELRCAAEHWRSLELTGWLAPDTGLGEARLALAGVPGASVGRILPAASGFTIEGGPLDIELVWKGMGVSHHRLQLALQAPQLHLTRLGRLAELRGLRGEWHLTAVDGTVQADMTQFTLEEPRLGATGRFFTGRSGQESRFDLQAEAIDVTALRRAVLAMAADHPPWSVLFDIVRGGRVPRLRLAARSESPGALFDLDRLELDATLEEGEIHVPGPQLECTQVSGAVAMAGGVLEGRQLAARLGGSRGSHGELRLDLHRHGPWSLAIDVEANLEQLPAVLQRVVTDHGFQRELARLNAFSGSAAGRLRLEAAQGQVHTVVEAERFALQAGHDRCPFTIEARGGGLHYSAGEIVLADAGIAVGASRAASLGGRLQWRTAPSIELRAAGCDIDLAQIGAWLAAMRREAGEGSPAPLVMRGGQVALRTAQLGGPLWQPAQWSLRAEGDVRELHLEAERLGGEVRVPQGSFSATERQVTMRRARLLLADSEVVIAGTVLRADDGVLSGALTLDGQVGPMALERVRGPLVVPAALAPSMPLSLTDLTVRWQTGAAVALTGMVADSRGARWSGDLTIEGPTLRSDRLAWDDGQSRGEISGASWDGRQARLAFSGRLSAASVNAWLAQPLVQAGGIEGELRAEISAGDPLATRIDGRLQLDGLRLPLPDDGPPLEVATLAMEGRDDRLRLATAELTRGENHLTLSGDVWREARRIRFDLDARSAALDLERLWFPAAGATTPALAGLPLGGVLRLKADQARYGQILYRPLVAHLNLEADQLRVELAQAVACGLQTPGQISVTPQGIALNLLLLAEQGSLDDAFVCLGEAPGRASAAFRFQGELKGQSAMEGLLPALQGRFQLDAGAGIVSRYHHFSLLRRLFGLLNLTEIFRGRLPDLDTEGFAFDDIQCKAALRDGQLQIEELFIDGRSMDIAVSGSVNLVDRTLDLGVLAAPLKTANFIIQHLPLVKDIMAGTLVSIPVRVSGPLADPSMIPLSPTMVGDNLLGIMKRTLQLPIRIIQPLLSDGESAAAP